MDQDVQGQLSYGILTEIPASPTFKYDGRHKTTIDNVLGELSDRSPKQIVVCAGLPGSPISRVSHVLADMFARGDYYDYASAIGEYKRVFSLDMGAVRAQNREDAKSILRQALARARSSDQSRELLVLERFQLLKDNEEIDRDIIGLLVSPGEAAVLALFELSDEYEDININSRFQNLNIRLVNIQKYESAYAVHTMESSYLADWRQQGYVIAPLDGLRTLFEIEPTLYVQGYRKSFPYLATDLVQEAIHTIRTSRKGGIDVSRTLLWSKVQSARDTLNELRRRSVADVARSVFSLSASESPAVKAFADQWADKVDAVRFAYNDLESFGLSEVRDVLAEQAPPNLTELSRSVIDAELFGGNRYSFRFGEVFGAQLRRKFPTLRVG